MELVAEAGAFGNLLDQRAGLLEPFGGAVHLQAHQKLVWTLAVVTLEQPAQVGGVHVAFLRYLAERLQPRGVFFDVLAALLVGRERMGFNAGAWREGLGNFQRQAFQQFCAQFRALASAALPAADEFVEEVLDFVWRKNPRDAARRQMALAQ